MKKAQKIMTEDMEIICQKCKGKGFIDTIPAGIERKEILPGLLEPEIKGIVCQKCHGYGRIKIIWNKTGERERMSHRLYKAKADHNGKWVFGYYLEVAGVPFILPEGKPLNAIVQVKPDTVCQDTGKTDKNGEKIFEDDRLVIVTDEGVVRLFVVKRVEDGHNSFDEATGRSCGLDSAFCSQAELDGNIHDNEESDAR